MKSIQIDYENSKIIISSAFKKRAFTPGTTEYAQLQDVRRDFAGFTLETRQFKKNTKQERYRGLTYDYMRDYIKQFDKDPSSMLPIFENMLTVSKGHSDNKRYPIVKQWFLDRYPEFAEFGMNEEQLKKYREEKEAANKVTALPTSDDKIPA